MHRVLTIALFTWLIVTMINKHHVYIMWLKMTQNQSFVLISWLLKLSSNRWSSFCQIWNQPKHDGLLINGAIPVYLGMIICSERYANTIALFFIHNTILISYERMNDMNKNKLYQNLIATCVKYTCACRLAKADRLCYWWSQDSFLCVLINQRRCLKIVLLFRQF